MANALYAPQGGLWYLEGLLDDSRHLHRIPILSLPFRIGRRPDMDLTLTSSLISWEHALIRPRGEGLEIVDLGSTNGTALNGARVTDPAAVGEGDTLHFATLEFRIGVLDAGRTEALIGTTTAVDTGLPGLLVERTVRLRRLLETGAVHILLQPIVQIDSRRPIGHEVLGRSSAEDLPLGSFELFELAAVVGAESRLSRLFRRRGARDCSALPQSLEYFFNTHPAELREDGLLESLEELRGEHPGLRLILEIHEGAVTEPQSMRRLQERLRELAIGLAYDDFGAGQARLTELAEAPPDYLKFDMAMIQGTDASPAKRRMVEALVAMAVDLGIEPIAEGVETELDAETCAAMGFRLAQGYLYGQPAPPAEAAG